MEQFVGLDVSQKETHVCVLDKEANICWRGKTLSTPEDIAKTLAEHAPHAVRVGLETGPLSTWHWHGLKDLGVPIICLCARHAKAALKMQTNKTDSNDARGLAEIVRTGWYRSVQVKSIQSHVVQAKINTRAMLVNMKRDVSSQVRGLMKTFGLVVGVVGRKSFDARVTEMVGGHPEVEAIVTPLLSTWEHLSKQIAALDRILLDMARENEDCRRLMTIPGVGAITALTFVSNIDEADRFSKSSNVGAYFGLTPKRYQSGEVDYVGNISKCGNGMMRAYLFEAALTLMTRVKKWCPLKAWAMQIAKRRGRKKAVVALARKMAVLMYAMLRDKTEFCWSAKEEAMA